LHVEAIKTLSPGESHWLSWHGSSNTRKSFIRCLTKYKLSGEITSNCLSTYIQGAFPVSVHLCANKYCVSSKDTQAGTLMAKLKVPTSTRHPVSGHVKFYDGDHSLGKGIIRNIGAYFLAICPLPSGLSHGRHMIYAIYQGDDHWSKNGSGLIPVYVVHDERKIPSEIRLQLEPYAKDERDCIELLKMYNGTHGNHGGQCRSGSKPSV
jgi:hypothetical protein